MGERNPGCSGTLTCPEESAGLGGQLGGSLNLAPPKEGGGAHSHGAWGLTEPHPFHDSRALRVRSASQPSSLGGHQVSDVHMQQQGHQAPRSSMGGDLVGPSVPPFPVSFLHTKNKISGRKGSACTGSRATRQGLAALATL